MRAWVVLAAVAAGVLHGSPSWAQITCDAASLRGAITASNATGETIDVPSGCVITFSEADPAGSNSALPVITGSFTIEGNGVRLIRSVAAPPFRFLYIQPGASLTVKDASFALGLSPHG